MKQRTRNFDHLDRRQPTEVEVHSPAEVDTLARRGLSYQEQTMTKEDAQAKVQYQRRELARGMDHAFQHGFDNKHNHLNLEAFLRELERFIEAKIAEAKS